MLSGRIVQVWRGYRYRLVGAFQGKQRHIREGVAMRSYEEPKHLNSNSVPASQPPYPRRMPSEQARTSQGSSSPGEQEARAKLALLVEEHRDLDAAIAALFEAKSCDHLLITRMKKRKLQLKDEIALLGS